KPHAMPHAVQFLVSTWVLVSQPSVALPLQSAKPGSHAPAAHWPPLQLAWAWGAAHALPQPPQLSGSLAVSAHCALQHLAAPPPQRSSDVQPMTQVAAESLSFL